MACFVDWLLDLQADVLEAQQQDEREIEQIKSLPISSEKRVISFGLYGSAAKYTNGAVRNAELAKVVKVPNELLESVRICKFVVFALIGIFSWLDMPFLCHQRCARRYHI